MNSSVAFVESAVNTGLRRDVLDGVKKALPVGAAIFPLGITLGVLISQAGLPWWLAPVFAGVIFAGTLEFLLVGMVLVMAPLTSIAVTALLVNFRHVFYALSFPLKQIRSRGWRAVSTYILCDEAWALTAGPRGEQWSGPRILGMQAAFYVNWVLATTVGVLLGASIPESIVGLDFAITAFFLVLSIDAYKERRSLPAPIIALGAALLAMVFLGDAMVLPAMVTIVGLLVIAHFWEQRGRRRA